MSLPTWDPLRQQSSEAMEKFRAYADFLLAWNHRVNLVSRRASADDMWTHVVHCLALTCRSFPNGSTVVDWGTGGGLPAIPLAIAFPKVAFHAVDAVEKKILAVQAMARALDLDNLTAHHARAEVWSAEAQYSVSRATAPLRVLAAWHLGLRRDLATHESGLDWAMGLHCLKGGDLEGEILDCRRAYPQAEISIRSLLDDLGCAGFQQKAIVSVLF